MTKSSKILHVSLLKAINVKDKLEKNSQNAPKTNETAPKKKNKPKNDKTNDSKE